MAQAPITQNQSLQDFTIDLWINGGVNELFEQAAFSSYHRVHENKIAVKISNLVTQGKLNLYFLVSPPGAGSVFMARHLLEAGNFDGCLLEPSGQFNKGVDRFEAALRLYQAAAQELKPSFFASAKKRRAINLLIVEKPQHIAPGAEMDFFVQYSKKILFLIRSPESCTAKRLKIAANHMAELTASYESLSQFYASGFLQEGADPELPAVETSRQAGKFLSKEIRDYMIGNNSFAALTSKSWTANQSVYEDPFMQADISLFRGLVGNKINTHDTGYEYLPRSYRLGIPGEMADCLHAYEWLREYLGVKFGSELEQLDPEEFNNFVIRRVSGWNALAEFNFASRHEYELFYNPEKYFNQPEENPQAGKASTINYSDFSKNPAFTVEKVLDEWGVERRDIELPLSEQYLHSPYGDLNSSDTLRAAFGKALLGPKEINPSCVDPLPESGFPAFLRRITMQGDLATYEFFQANDCRNSKL